MGIASSVDLLEKAGRRKVAGVASGPGFNSDRAQDSDGTPNSALTAVSAYIPSEALAVYLATLAILNPPPSAGNFKILLFALGLGLVCLFMLASFAGLRRPEQDQEPGQEPGQEQQPGHQAIGKRIVLVAFALVAFSLWAGAMPSSPFAGPITILDFPTDRTVLFGAGVIVAAAVLPIVAKALGLRPK